MPERRILTALVKKFWWLVILLAFVVFGTTLYSLRSTTGLPELDINSENEGAVAPNVTTGIGDFEGILRITVRDRGMYKLTGEDLKRYGWENVDPFSLRLYNLGQDETIWFSEEGDDLSIYFFAYPLDTPYTSDNIYFLTTSETPVPHSENHIPVSRPSVHFLPPLHLEENNVYLPKAEPEHTWFWKTLTAPKTETFEFVLDKAPFEETTLRFSLFASTEAGNIDPDHHIRIYLNSTILIDETWDGRGSRLVEASLSQGILQVGVNTLSLELPGDTGVVVDTILLDWVELEYSNSIFTENGHAEFLGTGTPIDLTGFSAPAWVFDLNDTGNGPPIELHPSNTLQILTELDHHYIGVPTDGFLTPGSVSPPQLSFDLRSSQADYLAIGPPDLLEALQPLLDHRETQGLSTLAIPINAIYDQFGGGVAHPEAIRAFLQHTFESWSSSPKYAVLVGDSTYDPRGYQYSQEINRVPSFFRFTYYGGETVSDVAFAQLDGDNLPDLIIGRIPARTPEQVTTLVEKTLAYERSPTLNGNNHILAIADGQEATFKTDAEAFLGYFPQDYFPILIAPAKGDITAPRQITEELDKGVLFMSYFGHGSITMLGKDRIYSVEDVTSLNNGGRLPVMINITCLAGLFTHPEVESLTEAMLWETDGGAVAALSATSLTVPTDQAYLTRAFTRAFVENPDATLGELFLAAQRQLPVGSTGVREVLDTFLLFGDPALNLP